MASFFISYTGSDRDEALWIAEELKALGHTPSIDVEIPPASDILAWMEQRMAAADRILCLFSETYLKAEFASAELRAAFWHAIKKKPGWVLPIVLEPCEMPLLLDPINRCDLAGLSRDAARARFRDTIKRLQPCAAARKPNRALSNVPTGVPRLFLGRDRALAAIEAALDQDLGRVAITALYGMRGVGKTVLAAAYADRHSHRYRTTWWIRSDTSATIRADLVGLGVRLEWVAPNAREEEAVSTVLDRLREQGEGILLVYDNAPDARSLRPLLPRSGRSHVLITSNDHAWREIADPVEIRQWPYEVGANYLIRRTGRSAADTTAALALAEALDGLPLAHEQAAAYCERRRVSFEAYRQRFEAAPAEVLDDSRHAPPDYHDGLTVAKTYALALEEAARLCAAAEPLLVHAALLAPEPIPLFLFAEGREKLPEPLASSLAGDGLIDALAALEAFALIQREAIVDERDPSVSTDTFRLHRLVRDIAAARCRAEARETALQGLREAVRQVYPAGVFNDPNAWPRARRLDALAMRLVGEVRDEADGAPTAAFLLDRLGSYRQGALGAYQEARHLLERALELREKFCGAEHPVTADSLNNLAGLLGVLREFAAARPLLERALAIREKALGPDHPDVASHLNNLGSLLRAQSDLASAKLLYQRALAIREKALGLDHPDVGQTLNNLAVLLVDEGDSAGARPLYERALAIAEQAFGEYDVRTARHLSNLATLLKDESAFAEARPLSERALAIRERALGPQHPDTATSLHLLAAVFQGQSDFAAARPLYERALAIREKAFGSEHPTTALSLNDLATVLEKQADTAAMPLYERALAILQGTVGPDDANAQIVAANINRLAERQASSGGFSAKLEDRLGIRPRSK